MDRTARNGATNNPEVSEKPRRRRFEAAYKLQSTTCRRPMNTSAGRCRIRRTV